MFISESIITHIYQYLLFLNIKKFFLHVKLLVLFVKKMAFKSPFFLSRDPNAWGK